MTGDISDTSATEWKKFTARQWVALIGFCGVETRKQVQKHLKQIEKAYGAMYVRTIVVTAIKEQQIDVNRKFSRVCFGDVFVEDI